jgi:N-sulfoglucosamine sulfohydrolase
MRCLICLAVFAVMFRPAAVRAADAPKKNVVLLIADDMGLDLGCYGNTRIKTPNLDALAKNGVRFSNAFATVSSCSPSRASLYSGLFSHSNGQYGLAHADHNFHSKPTVKSLPRLLNDAGYRTAILGKNHVIPKEVYPWGQEIPVNGRSVFLVAEKARQFISEVGDRPFCLVVGYADPHRAARGFGNETKYPNVPEVRYDAANVELPYHLPDQPDARQDLADYYQSATRCDHGVGLMLKVLDDAKKTDSTLVIFISDNGIPFPGAKTTLYDAGVHLPLIVSSPVQKKRGRANLAMVSFVDVMPTILDWAGVKAPPELPGRSLLPILDEQNPTGWDVVYGSHQFHEVTMYYPMRMVRTRTHKYLLNLAHQLEFPFASDIYNSPTWQGVLKRGDKMLGQRSVESFLHRPHEELYDLTKDPNELKNLAGDPAQAKVLDEMRKQMRAWQEKTKDPWVVKYTHE